MGAVTIPLPVADAAVDRSSLRLRSPELPRLPRVEWVVGGGNLLLPGPADQPELLSLDVADGCVHQCGFCAVRARADYDGDRVIRLRRDVVEQLEKELGARRVRPKAVYISPSTDPFPPVAEVQAQTVRVVEALAVHGIGAWLMTRGHIRPGAVQALATRRDRVRVTVCVTTASRTLQRTLEPWAAPPRLRLRQIAGLRRAGVPVQVALEPLLPGLTDTAANLAPLFDALAAVGVRQVAAGYLFLRPGIRENLGPVLEPHGWEGLVLDAFAGARVLRGGRMAPASFLPKAQRQRRYAALMALAAGFGIAVRVSGLTNPDFGPAAGAAPSGPRQRLLPCVP